MALAILAEIPELTGEDYERVVKKVNESGSLAGALPHAGGPMEGGYRIVEVWETREAADAFYGPTCTARPPPRSLPSPRS